MQESSGPTQDHPTLTAVPGSNISDNVSDDVDQDASEEDSNDDDYVPESDQDESDDSDNSEILGGN